MDKLRLSTANLVIAIAGVAMLIGSFLAFNKYSHASVVVGNIHLGGSVTYTAWSTHYRLIATIPVLVGIAMAAQIGVAEFAPAVRLPDTVLGLTWNQIHLVLGFQATIMMLSFLLQDTGLDKGFGLILMLIASVALLVGAILRVREAPTSSTPPV